MILQIINARLEIERHEQEVRQFNLGLSQKEVAIQPEHLRILMAESETLKSGAEVDLAVAQAKGSTSGIIEAQ